MVFSWPVTHRCLAVVACSFMFRKEITQGMDSDLNLSRSNHLDSNQRISVLVFPCASEIGLEIHRSLAFSRNIDLIGASSACSNHGPYVYKNYVSGMPFVDSPDFFHEMERLVRNVHADAVFPAHDSVVLALAEQWHNSSVKLITSPVETCRICRDKDLTYKTLQDVIRVPGRFHPRAAKIDFPVFLKPAVGQGSKNTLLVHNRAEMQQHLRIHPDCLVMEYLPGPEYTIDCFTDRHGALRFCGPRERNRIANGISVDTAPVVDCELTEMATQINNILKFRGVWFFQVKRDTAGDPALLEVSPRVAGSMALYRSMGVNLPLLSLYDALGSDVEILPLDGEARLDRALINRFKLGITYKHVYIDFDDTIVINGKVNVSIAAFLYQCRNSGIGLHLLSRHKGDVFPLLDRFALRQLFDTVTIVAPTAKKAPFITRHPAIFIDDSFAERRDVRLALGIPVFGVDAVESLLDWRL